MKTTTTSNLQGFDGRYQQLNNDDDLVGLCDDGNNHPGDGNGNIFEAPLMVVATTFSVRQTGAARMLT